MNDRSTMKSTREAGKWDGIKRRSSSSEPEKKPLSVKSWSSSNVTPAIEKLPDFDHVSLEESTRQQSEQPEIR